MTLKGYEFAPVTKFTATGYLTTIPTCLADRPGVVMLRANSLVVQVIAKPGDDCQWSQTERKGYWTLVLPFDSEPTDLDFIRVVVYGDGAIQQPDGTYHKKKGGGFTRSSDTTAGRVIRAKLGVGKSEADCLIGECHLIPWQRVCIPFAGEYPGDRQWNIGAPQYVYQPSCGPHTSWDAIIDHVGEALKMPPELQVIGIRSGGDYLRAWFACILRDPACRLPYLFLFGDENCGKSILWEAFSLLVTGGVVKADRALNSDFNGEIDGAILCVIEEKDVSGMNTLPRIKDAVTGLTLAVRRMHTDVYHVTNYTHWIQTANNSGACRIPIGDTRFVAIHVKALTSEVPKPELLERLKAEGPAIMHTLLNMTLPEPQGRLALPVIATDAKAGIQEENLDPLAHKIVDFMSSRIAWEGSAKELRDAVGGAPGNIAGLKSAVSGFASYLRENRIIVKFPKRQVDRRYIIKLRRVA
ncbi:primase-helicase family protein [Lacipirellula parvula]|uniref:NrS-1 polymerase-like helicase domain-containing protein n=1 Tax=Lacipirellula parvula TaxID=2650471 RepID=A0A5K7XEZ4_9BACT|nr:primase-helicase family protein [Lacipirellula parvula]BBO34572.1 hypothetical protein PLANPX_4184 [Lacipirellula parvula]